MTDEQTDTSPQGRCAFQLADLLEETVLSFRDALGDELQALASQLGERDGNTKERVAAYASLFKMLQGVELMTNGIRQQQEAHVEHEREMVEFRRELEAAIASLVDASSATDVPGEAQG